jgi:DNA-binding transcriptional LysR family regulator
MKPALLELLPDMALFAAVAQSKSFSKAARALGMPVSTLSRRIASLEQRVGLQLVIRTTRAVALSAAGAAYALRCQAILEAAEAAQGELAGRLADPAGHLRVSATPDFSLTFLTPLFADFAARHPGITFEFDLTPRSVDLVTEQFDVAIRRTRLFIDCLLEHLRLGDQ